ncbi:ATP-dependent zinc protease [Terrabacter aeriphilus]|uniref:ATP-dependent zinc protease n=1 Tax=Terrabacter aeriphilus TaxID=515662 RepID=A0ABP9J3J7_9MICO
MTGPAYSSTPVGWREWVGLPGIGMPWLKAKIDTGARTSALHAADLEEFERDGAPWVRFTAHPWQDTDDDAVQVECPVHDRRHVRSSSGHAQQRYVVLLDLSLAGRTVPAEVTLTNRHRMGFRMLVGREALRQGFVVDPGRSYAGARAPKEFRRRNHGH